MDERTAILREWFDRVDSGRTGSITALQLKRALAVGNLDIAITVVEQMIRMYDFDRNGTMSFEEFVALNKFLLKVQHAFSDLERPWLKWVSHWTPQHFTLSVRALIKRRMADSGWMISYLSAYLCSLLVIYLIHLILLSRGGLPSISINSSIALRIAAYEIYMNVRSRGLPSKK